MEILLCCYRLQKNSYEVRDYAVLSTVVSTQQKFGFRRRMGSGIERHFVTSRIAFDSLSEFIMGP